MFKKINNQKLIFLLFIVIFMQSFCITKSARILILTGCPSLSHNLFYHRIIKELSLRGHTVVSITADPMNNTKLTNLTEISVHDVAYSSFQAQDYLKTQQSTKTDFTSSLRNFLPSVIASQDGILSDPKVKYIINNESEHFDLFISEMIWGAAFYGFKERFNCPFIGIASLDVFLNQMDAVGNPSNPSYMVDVSKLAGTSFWQRLDNFLHAIKYRWFYHWEMIPKLNQILMKHFYKYSKMKDVSQLEKSVDILLINNNPIFIPPRPLTPNIIPIGGLHMRERHPLPQDLQKLLDNSKEGAIYFSLGSNVNSKNIHPNMKSILLNTFGKLPYTILWKWEEDNVPVKNIITRKWFPQQDVLSHPNIKLFITQGGIQSIDEALRSKVPMIGMPFCCDQEFNTERFVALGIGKQLSVDDLTEDQFEDAISEVITNPKYKKQIDQVSTLIWDQETQPLDRSIWWIEYVLRHGGAQHLRSPGADLPWYKYLLLDVIAFLFVGVILVLFLILYVIRFILQVLLKTKYKTD